MPKQIVKTMLSPELLEQVKAVAKVNGTSVSQVIRKLVMDGLDK